MKLLVVILGVITCLTVLSNLICGLWIRANNVVEISSHNFHMYLGIVSVVLSVVTSIAVIILATKYFV